MIKLIFSKFKKDIKLNFGSIIAFFISSVVITSCLFLVFSSYENQFQGERFSNVDNVIIMNRLYTKKIVKNAKKHKIKYKTEDISGVVYIPEEVKDRFLENELNIYDYTFYASINGVNGNIAGHNQKSMKLTGFYLIKGKLPSYNQVVIDFQLAKNISKNVGDIIKIKTNIGNKDYRISGIVNTEYTKAMKTQSFLFFNEKESKELNKYGGLCSIGIIGNVNTNNLSKDVKVLAGKNKQLAESPLIRSSAETSRIIFIVMGSIALLVAFFVLVGTISFSVRHRLKEYALLKTIGALTSQLIFMIVSEIVVLSIISCCLGSIAAIPISKLILFSYKSYGSITSNFKLSYSNLAMIMSVGAITLTSIIVVLLVSVKTLKIPPMAAIKQIAVESKNRNIIRIIIGSIFLIGGIAILLFTPIKGAIGIGMCFIACGLFLGAVAFYMPILIRVFNIILNLITIIIFNKESNLVKSNVKNKAIKFSVASLSLCLMFSVNAVMFLNNICYMNSVANIKYKQLSNYDCISLSKTTIEEFNKINTSKMGIKKDRVIISSKNGKPQHYNALGVTNNNNLKLNMLCGNLNNIGENECIISNMFRYNVGEDLQVVLPNGTEKMLKIKGKFEVESDATPDLIINSNLLLENSYYSLYDIVLCDNSQNGKYTIFDMNTFNAASNEGNIGAIIIMMIISITLGGVSLFNTFTMVFSVRKEEFTSLKIIGATKSQILKMTILETIVIVVSGLVAGCIITSSILYCFSSAQGVYTSLFVDNDIYFKGVLVTCCLGLLAGIIPSFITIIKLKQKYKVD